MTSARTAIWRARESGTEVSHLHRDDPASRFFSASGMWTKRVMECIGRLGEDRTAFSLKGFDERRRPA